MPEIITDISEPVPGTVKWGGLTYWAEHGRVQVVNKAGERHSIKPATARKRFVQMGNQLSRARGDTQFAQSWRRVANELREIIKRAESQVKSEAAKAKAKKRSRRKRDS